MDDSFIKDKAWGGGGSLVVGHNDCTDYAL